MSEITAGISDGMRDQLAVRRERLRAGERPLGWKVGLGTQAAMEKLGTGRPLAGFLMESSVVEDGASVPIGSWTSPAMEPEIAVHLGADVAPDASWEDVRAAIRGVSAAIELVDSSPPSTDPREILAGNIFHRHVLLGPVDEGRSTGEGIPARVLVDGEEVAANDAPGELTGEIVEVVRLTAELLGAVGERARAGEVIITGSMVPPVKVAAGQHVAVDLGPLGGLSVQLTE
jgi:2-keto-4-pentenoate hydratase